MPYLEEIRCVKSSVNFLSRLTHLDEIEFLLMLIVGLSSTFTFSFSASTENVYVFIQQNLSLMQIAMYLCIATCGNNWAGLPY